MLNPHARKAARLGGAVALAVWTLPATHAANLLVNPGFEAPTDLVSSESTLITGWTLNGTIKRSVFNDIPPGRWDLWARTFEPLGFVFQDVTGIDDGTSYTFSTQMFFEANFNQTTATVYGNLDWRNAGGTTVGTSEIAVPFNSNPTTGVWTPFSINPTAPAGATQVRVSFGWRDGGGSGPQLSAFLDDVVLDGVGNPAAATWILNGSGDWNNSDNWGDFQVPNAASATANFLSAITGPQTVFNNSSVTVGSVNFNNANTYVLTGAGTLTLQTTAGNAQVAVTQGRHKINLPTTVASNTVFNVSSGANLVIGDPLTINAGRTVTQTGAGTVTYESIVNVGGAAGISMGNSTHMAALNIAATGSATLTAGGNKVVKTDNISIAGTGTFDLHDNDLIVVNSNYATISGLVANARNSGAWNQPGITSTAAKNHPTDSTTLGVLRGSEYLAVNSSTFNGFTVAATDTLVKYTWYGDTDFNGSVDFDDYVRTDAGFNNGSSGWVNGDFDLNGGVDFDDYVLLDLGFNTQSGTLRRAIDFLSGEDRSMKGMNTFGLRKVVEHYSEFGSDYANNFLSSVPEPAAMGMLMLPALALRRRRGA